MPPTSPSPLQLLPCLIPCPYHYLVCYPAHGHTGVFQNNFLRHKLLALIFAINPFCFSLPSLLLSRTFFATSFAEKMHTLFCRPILSNKPLFPLFPLLQFFIFLNVNHPANPIMLYPWFYEGEREIWRLTTLVYNSPPGCHQLSNSNSNYLTLTLPSSNYYTSPLSLSARNLPPLFPAISCVYCVILPSEVKFYPQAGSHRTGFAGSWLGCFMEFHRHGE
jgi:hypothetical protein